METLDEARARLAARIDDPKVRFVPGLADDLRALLVVVDELGRRTSTLAAFALRKHFWPASAVHRAQLQALMEMGAEPTVVGRIGTHSDGCLCEHCMGHSG